MATGEDLRRIALSLPRVIEAPHFDRLAFRARRVFATLAADRKSANLKFAPLKGGWGAAGWTHADLSALDETELRAAVESAWRHAQPKARGKAKKPARAARRRP